MCYDISFTVKLKELETYLPDLMRSPQLELDYSSDHFTAFRYPEYPIIRRQGISPVLQPMGWGVIPFYVNDEHKFGRERINLLNAGAESILNDRRSVWHKIKNHRCLIPVTGIFEHRGIEGWPTKIPYFITLKDQPVFFIPGLYSTAKLPDPETGEISVRYTFTLITRSGNELFKKIHNEGEFKYRMPLFLSHDLALQWIDPNLSEINYREILNFKLSEEHMNALPVWSIRSDEIRPDNKLKTEYWEWKNLPPLGDQNPPEYIIIQS